ncbi:MAG TPA: tetratricopeptide repeat protein [Saprospiraceae bacterium]|nr:tetratricopeptide repeat protein [Saprospiraceae bacterium]
MNNPYLKIENNQYVPFSTAEKSATITYTLGKYVQLLFFPHPLTHDYYPRHIAKMSWSDWRVILSLLIYLALLVYGIYTLLKKEIIGFGILFYLGTLFLVSNIIFPIGTNMAERFLFMPSIGFCFVVALLLYKYLGTNSLKENFKKLSTPFIILGIISLLFAGKTFVRNFVWKDNYTLFTTDIKVSKNSAKLRNSVGGELVETFKNEKNANLKKQKLNEAVAHLKEAIRIHPNYKNAFLILGNAYNYLQQYQQSIAAYNNALRIDPNYEQARQNLGITYREAGKYYGEQKNDINNAIKNLKEAYKILGDTDPETIRLLGVAFGMSGNTQKAISYFQKLVSLQPNNAGAFWNLANAYRFAGNLEKENEFRQKAKKINPNIENEFK